MERSTFRASHLKLKVSQMRCSANNASITSWLGRSTAAYPPALKILQRDIHSCRRCPRLTAYLAEVAITKRKSYAGWDYWAKPVSGFGDPKARVWILGLAPGAHGANRTGRVFTGDRSGDFLFAALHRRGLANQPTSVSTDDGLELSHVFISASARCAPPGNQPLPTEIANCQSFLDAEWKLLAGKRVILALGSIAWNAALSMADRNGCGLPARRPKFSHGAECVLEPGLMLLGSYHVSQQNTFTGRLTTEMFNRILLRCSTMAAEAAIPV